MKTESILTSQLSAESFILLAEYKGKKMYLAKDGGIQDMAYIFSDEPMQFTTRDLIWDFVNSRLKYKIEDGYRFTAAKIQHEQTYYYIDGNGYNINVKGGD